MSRKQLIVIVGFLFVVSIGSLVGISYAVFTKTLTGSKSLSVTTGTLKVDFQEGNAISLNNAYPMSDSTGLKTMPYTFTIKNGGNIKAYYTISFEEDSSNTLNNQYVKYKLTGNNGYDSGVRSVSELGTGTIEVAEEQELVVNQTVNYTLYLWLSDQAGNEVQGQTYQNKIVVNGSSNPMGKNGSSPMLASNMIPVVYDEAKTSWVKADVNKDWYNYEEQKWANAVTVDQNKVLDLSGNNNHGKINGATVKNGEASFDGVDDFIDCGLANYDFGNQQTLIIRFKPNVIENQSHEIFGNWEHAGSGIAYYSNGKILYTFYSPELDTTKIFGSLII